MAKLVTVRVETSEVVVQWSKDWLIQESGGQYAYVEAELPKVERVTVLEQTLPAEEFDLKAVIRAINGL